MLSVPLYNMQGERQGEMEVDPARLGGEVRPALIKQAVVIHLDRKRRDNARTKGRGDVQGSTRKLYRQKGTGNARVGNIRTVVRRGGGVAFAKRGPRARLALPKKMRQLARSSALLAKLQSEDVCVIDGPICEAPKTKVMAALLGKLGADRGCLIATEEHDQNVYLSARNLPKTEIRKFSECNAYDIVRRNKVVVSKAALERFLAGDSGESEGDA